MLDNDYKDHEIHMFLVDLEKFYEKLSFGIFCWGSIGVKSIVNVDTYFYSSLKGTIKSIKNIVKGGQLNDAYALLRKYHDSIIINSYVGLYIKDNSSTQELIVTKIDSWIKESVKLPRYREMNNYIKNSELLKEINPKLQ
jgi:hypothetical protein